MAKVNILGVVGICCFVLALIFSILAASLTLWEKGVYTYEDNFFDTTYMYEYEVEIGLWKKCGESDGLKTCIDIPFSDSVLSKYKAVRAMVILAILLLAGAIICGILALFVMKKMKMLYFVASGLSVMAGTFLMIGMSVYVAKLEVKTYDYAAAFAFDILAWIASWIGGGMFIGAKMTATD